MERELLGLLPSSKWHNRLWLDALQVNKLQKYWKEDASFERRLAKYLWCELLTIYSSDFKLTSLFPFLCLEGKACHSDVQVVSRLSCLSICAVPGRSGLVQCGSC